MLEVVSLLGGDRLVVSTIMCGWDPILVKFG